MRHRSFYIILIALPVSLFAGLLQAQPPPADTTINSVRIQFRYSPGIFPRSWTQPPINAKGVPIDKSEIARSKQVLQGALGKYPAVMLKKELRAVYMLRDMFFYEVAYGGTNTTDALYLCNNGKQAGYSDLYIEQSFHHEFSSILYRNYPLYFDESAWKNAHIAGFDYNDPENGVGAIRNNESSQELDTALCRKGFLTQYSMSGIENDLNTVAQNLFAPSAGFWDIADRYPRIRTKVTLLIAFYKRIHPGFTETFFRQCSKK